VPPGDELGEDGDRDLLLAQRPEVEAGGAADAGQRRVIDAPVAAKTAAARRVLATRPT
jgi:hypothetical protein